MDKLDYIKLTYDGVSHRPLEICYVSHLPQDKDRGKTLWEDWGKCWIGFPKRSRLKGEHYNVYVRTDLVTVDYFRYASMSMDRYEDAMNFILGGVIDKL